MDLIKWLLFSPQSAPKTRPRTILLQSPRDGGIPAKDHSPSRSPRPSPPWDTVGSPGDKRTSLPVEAATPHSARKRRRRSPGKNGGEEENDSDFGESTNGNTPQSSGSRRSGKVQSQAQSMESTEEQSQQSPHSGAEERVSQQSPSPSARLAARAQRKNSTSEIQSKLNVSPRPLSPSLHHSLFASPQPAVEPESNSPSPDAQRIPSSVRRRFSSSAFASPRPPLMDANSTQATSSQIPDPPFSLPMVSTPPTSSSTDRKVISMISTPLGTIPTTQSLQQQSATRAAGTPPLTGPRSRKLLHLSTPSTGMMMPGVIHPSTIASVPPPVIPLDLSDHSIPLPIREPQRQYGLEDENGGLNSIQSLKCGKSILDDHEKRLNPSPPTIRKLSFEMTRGDDYEDSGAAGLADDDWQPQETSSESPTTIPYDWSKEHPILKRVRSQLCPNRVEDGKEFFGLDVNRARLAQVLQEAYEKREPASVLLVGPEGSGKTHCIQGALRDVAKQLSSAFRIIELDGRFLVTDVLAAREVTRQLCLTTHEGVKASLESLEAKANDDDGDDDGDSSDDDDDEAGSVGAKPSRRTLARPEELGGAQGTFSDHLRFLVRVLKEEKTQSTGERLVFLLRNFDDFCRRPKQTLLYALLDMAHSPDANFVLIAVSEGIDCVSHLDKRVRSRFDNIQLVFPKTAYSVEGMVDLVKSRLLIQAQRPSMQVDSWNRMVEDSLDKFRPHLQVLIMAGGLTVGFVLRHIANVSFSRLQRLIWQRDPLGKVGSTILFGPSLGLDFVSVLPMCVDDQQGNQVKAMGREELVLLMSAVYLERVKRMDSYSFEALYESSHKIRKGSPDTVEQFQIRTTRKDVSLMVFDGLVRKRFFRPVGAVRKNVPKEYRPMQLVFDDVDSSFLGYVKNKPDQYHICLVYWAKHLLGL